LPPHDAVRVEYDGNEDQAARLSLLQPFFPLCDCPFFLPVKWGYEGNNRCCPLNLFVKRFLESTIRDRVGFIIQYLYGPHGIGEIEPKQVNPILIFSGIAKEDARRS
jgi:hypothetical protein